MTSHTRLFVLASFMWLLALVPARAACDIIALGADPTGVADSHTPIQTCLNLGGRVHVPRGSYRTSLSLTVVLPTTLVGDGAGPPDIVQSASTIYSDSNTVDVLVIEASAVVVQDLVVAGGGGATRTSTSGGNGIVVGKSGNVRYGVVLRNVSVNSNNRSGIVMVAAQHFQMRGVSTNGWLAGLETRNWGAPENFCDCTITESFFYASDVGAGIWMRGGGPFFIANSKFLGGRYHIWHALEQGAGGTFSLMGSSLEPGSNPLMPVVSILFDGPGLTNSIRIIGNAWVVQSPAIVTNQVNLGSGFRVDGMVVANNTFIAQAAPVQNGIIDLWASRDTSIYGNIFFGGAIGLNIHSTSERVYWGLNSYNGTQLNVQNTSPTSGPFFTGGQ